MQTKVWALFLLPVVTLRIGRAAGSLSRVVASCVSLVSAFMRKLAHCAAPPFPVKQASLGSPLGWSADASYTNVHPVGWGFLKGGWSPLKARRRQPVTAFPQECPRLPILRASMLRLSDTFLGVPWYRDGACSTRSKSQRVGIAVSGGILSDAGKRVVFPHGMRRRTCANL